jgi:hypothetical protein
LELYSEAWRGPHLSGKETTLETNGKRGNVNPYDLSSASRAFRDLKAQAPMKAVKPGDPYTLSGSKLRNALSLKRGTGYLKD